MKVGFTGTQRGMTVHQERVVYQLLENFRPSELHHGDCIGADAKCHEIFRRQTDRRWVVIHPPINESKRAFCAKSGMDQLRKPKDYLDRNHDIVDEVDVMISTPGEAQEQLRSGTWATIRYARRQKKRIFIILPDGQTTSENHVR